MRKLFALLAAAVMFSGFAFVATAADEKGKDVTLTGDGVCAKCALKVQKSCQNVVIVKNDGKEVKYFLAKNDVAKEAHQGLGICQAKTDAPVKIKVTGTCKKDGDKLVVTATKIEKAD